VSPSAGRRIEIASIVVIALAILIGGRSLLVSMSAFPQAGVAILTILGIAQLLALRRDRLTAGPQGRLHATRDIAFLAAVVGAIAFVASPARWSIGASIAAVEFGLALELLTRLAPSEPESGAP
jgi:hypothetical protein